MNKTILEILKSVPDYRKGNGIRHVLSDVLMMGLLTIICGGNTCADMPLFGETHKKQLEGFLELPHGIPSHDTFEDVFSKLNPKTLVVTFQLFLEEIRDSLKGATIAIDGKTIRRSKEASKKATHVVTAFASECQLVLGQLATDEKSNEITAIPQLLDMFCVKDKIITIDAMGTQTDIAQKIIDNKGDYVLSLKGNQATLHDDVRLYLNTEVIAQNKKVLQEKGQYAKTLEKGHGRIETRECYICNDISWLQGSQRWLGLVGIGVIVSKREQIGHEPTTNCEYFIYSIKGETAHKLLKIKRSHWAIENNLHWMLDVLFREDECRARLENAAENLNILRKQALQLMKQEASVKGSMRSKRLRCAYDIFYALKVVGVNNIS